VGTQKQVSEFVLLTAKMVFFLVPPCAMRAGVLGCIGYAGEGAAQVIGWKGKSRRRPNMAEVIYRAS
jgi:hypothetical protein